MYIVNNKNTLHACYQKSVGNIEERISSGTILRPEQFSFLTLLKKNNVQMKRIRGGVKKEKSPLLSNLTLLPFFYIPMYDSLITSGHFEEIEHLVSFRWYIYIYFRELLSVKDFYFGIGIRFIILGKIKLIFFSKRLKFLKLLTPVLVGQRRGSALWTFYYSFMPYVKKEMKSLNLNLLGILANVCCQASLYLWRLCRSEVLQTVPLHEQLIMDLRLCQKQVHRTFVLSILMHFVQPLTLWGGVISIYPTMQMEHCSTNLSNISREQIKKHWLFSSPKQTLE